MATTYTTNNIAYPYTTGNSTFTVTSTGTSGSTLNYNGTTASWTQPTTHFFSSNQKSIMSIPHGEERIVLEDKATLDVKGTVKINGLDLEERLKTIERVLCIPQRDAIMEAKYPRLKKLFDEYVHELEKYYTWERIKGENDGTA